MSARSFRKELWLVAVIGLWTTPLFAQPRLTLKVGAHPISIVAVSPDSKTLASGNRGSDTVNTIKLWDMNTGKEKRTLKGPASGDFFNGIISVTFSPDGKTLAMGCSSLSLSGKEEGPLKEEGPIIIWDTKTWKEIRTLKGHDEGVYGVDFSPDGKTLASCSWDETVKLWDVKTGNQLRTLTGHKGNIWYVRFSPDGKTLASGGETEKTIIWDVDTGKEEWSHKFWGPQVAFSSDGKTFAISDYDKIHLFDTKTRKEKLSLTTQNHREISSVAFSMDGKILASCGSGKSFTHGTIKLWDTESGRVMRTLKLQDEVFSSVIFSPDGKTLISCGNGHPLLQGTQGTVKLWNLSGNK